MTCWPTVRAAIAPLGTRSVALEIPPLVLTGAVPSTTEPSRKETLPLGGVLNDPGALTVAVKVIGWPVTEGLALETTELLVAALAIASVAGAEVLWLKLGSLPEGEPLPL